MSPLNILHLEDSPTDAYLIEQMLVRNGVNARLVVVDKPDDFCDKLATGKFDLVLSDSSVPGFSAIAALHHVTLKKPGTPFICVTGAGDRITSRVLFTAGAADYIVKDELEKLPASIRQVLDRPKPAAPASGLQRGTQVLVAAVQSLSLARDIETIREIVRRAARELTGADGATFVLRDGDHCHYVDEDAISPLWKGQRFPLSTCISGWVMLNRQSAVIDDIYADARIPADAYRPTFVKSLVMVPIRTTAPIGAIGNYWASRHQATPEQIELLQALANTTAVAMENVQVYQELEKRVRDRTAQLHSANQELEAFSYSVSHDLRAPLRAIKGFAGILQLDASQNLDETSRLHLSRILEESARMGSLIEDLLRLSQVTRSELNRESVNLSDLVTRICNGLAVQNPQRQVELTITPQLTATCDRGLITAVLENLLSNAWKYSSKVQGAARVQFGSVHQADGTPAFFVRDNGAGFDMNHALRLFAPFQRLHSAAEFPGTGVGLATVQRIVHRHGGRIWAEAQPGRGATFFFTLPPAE
ncbi:ATP-binding protein [Oleiharenicola lentus]|uniref:ATP-binding protein n=1 Tax=Oleiharenicola lentus TaxID=2508720 RepID=UPI003F66E1AD